MNFVLAHQFRDSLGASDEEIHLLEDYGILNQVMKDGRMFYSDRDAHRARSVLHFMRVEEMPLHKAMQRVDGAAGFVASIAPEKRS
jgi:hypothetical protein